MSNYAIYQPKSKAAEYSVWACNFYVGCSNGCHYCFLKKGRGKATLGGDTPTLKKCFKNEAHAIGVFEKELLKNLNELKKHGLFFSFTTDPFLEETIDLTIKAAITCLSANIPVKILSKCADTYVANALIDIPIHLRTLVAIGYTLTGFDHKESNASSNLDRISIMDHLKSKGFKTFASIEPIITFQRSKEMINAALPYCDLFKVGLESGKKYDVVEAQMFVEWLIELQEPKIYLKESLQKLTGYKNSDLDDYFVEMDYNLFK